MKKMSIFLIAIFSLGLTSDLEAQKARIKEEKVVFKTYPFSVPEAAPIMSRASMWGRGQKLYPYFFFTKMSHEGENRTWDVVSLENPYIQVFVSPATGGKVLGAFEKSTALEFIYYNHARKFRQIALRGPWTSGGIEFNFGIVGHEPTTATPVDYLIRENEDGSVSCFVGVMDLPSRTSWTVCITLPPDKAYFETRSLYYNPTPFHQPYYVWLTAANKVGEDLEFIFPGTSFIGHSYNAPEFPWPGKNQGLDLSLYKNHRRVDFGSLFIHGVLEDFSGCYWNDSRFGFGHWALYDDMPGQKFFRWPLDRSGGIWEDLLTDTDGQYFEPQYGRLFDQNDHEFFAPYSADTWKDIWFPYKDIGPLDEASPHGVLNVTRKEGAVVLGFCALQSIDDDLVVFSEDEEVFRKRLKLAPMETHTTTVPVNVGEGRLRVKIGEKLTYSDDPEATRLRRPLNFRNYDDSSVEQIYLNAERFHKSREYDQALTRYAQVLEKQPDHIRALTRTAELYCRRAEYDKALSCAAKALDFSMYDPDANYIYGVISRYKGNFVDARETFGWAARAMTYRSAAYCQLAEIALMEGDLNLAEEYIGRSMDYNVHNIKALQVKTTIHRLRDQPDKMSRTLDRLLDIDPLNHLARFERYLGEPGENTLKDFTLMIRSELPRETYLETAMYYVNLGLKAEALKVLDNAPGSPVISLWQAYLLREEDPERSRDHLEKAASLSPYLVFPYREEVIPVLKWAKTKLQGNWKTNYYLGLVYWGKGRYEEARQEFTACADKPDYAPFYIARGFLFRENDPKRHITDFERALKLDPEDWQNWHHVISLYNQKGLADKALPLAQKASRLFPEEDPIVIDLARTYLNNRLYRECYDVLKDVKVLPYEGQSDTHRLFVESQVRLAMTAMIRGEWRDALKNLDGARTYPESLGTGKPRDPDFRLQDFLSALCFDRTGDKDQAEKARKRIYDFSLRNVQRIRSGPLRYFSAKVFELFGDPQQSLLLLQGWSMPEKGDIVGDAVRLIQFLENSKEPAIPRREGPS